MLSILEYCKKRKITYRGSMGLNIATLAQAKKINVQYRKYGWKNKKVYPVEFLDEAMETLKNPVVKWISLG